MKKLLTVVLLAGLTAYATAQEKEKKPADPPKPAPVKKKLIPKPVKIEITLKVGDPAPALKATKWLQGDEVSQFASDKVYVVEFWATWCGPCIVMMPHMAEMQRQYKDKVTFIGYSPKDANNTEDKVVKFVEKRGPKLGYTFAYADDRDTYTAWMTAAGQRGIPCSFVVGKDGRIAYIGHPMYLDIVLPKVVDGTWKPDGDVPALKKVETEVNEVFKSFSNADPEVGLTRLVEFESKYPPLAHIPYFVRPKLDLLIKAKKLDEAKEMAEEVIAKAVKQDDPLPLGTVSSVLQSPGAKDNKELAALSLKAAEAGVKVAGENDARALLSLAQAYFTAGEKDKAKETGKKALAAAEEESPAVKKFIEAQVKKFDDGN